MGSNGFERHATLRYVPTHILAPTVAVSVIGVANSHIIRARDVVQANPVIDNCVQVHSHWVVAMDVIVTPVGKSVSVTLVTPLEVRRPRFCTVKV